MAAVTAPELTADLSARVRGWERRWRWRVVLEWLPRVLAPGLLTAALLAIYSRLQPGVPNSTVLAVAVGGAAFGALVLMVGVMLRRRVPVEIARRFDQRFGLQERVSTALELSGGVIHADLTLSGQQMDDARAAAAAIDAKTLVKLPFNGRDWAIVALALATLLIMLLLMAPVSGQSEDDLQRQAAVDTATAAVQDILQDIAADPDLTDEQRQPLLEALQTQLDTLSDPEVSTDEAFAALSEVEAALEERAEALQEQIEQQQRAQQAASEALRQAGAPEAATVDEAIQSLQEQLSGMDAAQREAAAQSLEDAANAFEQTNPELAESLRQAAEALRENDIQAAQEAMAEAAQQAREAQAEAQQQQAQADAMQQNADAAQQAQEEAAGQSPSEQQEGGDQGQNSQQQGGGQPNSSDQSGTGETLSEGERPGEGGGSQSPPNIQSEQPSESEAAQGLGGDGAGDGQADLSQDASANGQAQNPDRSTDNNPDGDGMRSYEAIFAPRFSTEAGGTDEVRLSADPGDAPLREGEFQDNPLGSSVVPYNEVFSNYADSATRALDSDYIPLGLRDVVREYFSSLDPR
jgi:membrane protein involved in colicin uptake